MNALMARMAVGGGANHRPPNPPLGKKGRKKNKNRNLGAMLGQTMALSTRGYMANVVRQPKMKREFSKNGTLIVTNEEPFLVLTGNGQEATFNPGSSGMTMLDNIAAQYDQYKIRSCSMEYVTGVGTTTAGGLVMGIDYNPQSDLPSDNSYSAVSILEPKYVGAVWSCGRMAVEVARAMKGNTWRFTTNTGPSGSAFVLRANIDTTGSSFGKVWCKYSVEFCSPKTVGTSTLLTAPSSRVHAEFVQIRTQTSVVAANTTTTNFSPAVDPFVNGNVNFHNTDGTAEIDLPMPPCGSGIVTTCGVTAPSYAFQAALNGPPVITVLTTSGTDITSSFKITNVNLSPGVADSNGNITGFWAAALLALIPIASEYIIKWVTKIVNPTDPGPSQLTPISMEGTAVQATVQLPQNTYIVPSSDVMGLVTGWVGNTRPSGTGSAIPVASTMLGVSAGAVTDSSTGYNVTLNLTGQGDITGRYMTITAASVVSDTSDIFGAQVQTPTNVTLVTVPVDYEGPGTGISGNVGTYGGTIFQSGPISFNVSPQAGAPAGAPIFFAVAIYGSSPSSD